MYTPCYRNLTLLLKNPSCAPAMCLVLLMDFINYSNMSKTTNGKDALWNFSFGAFHGIQTVSGAFHETWKTFMKCVYFSDQILLPTFLINKKIEITMKRYLKVNSIQLVFVTQKRKRKKLKKTKTYLNETIEMKHIFRTCVNRQIPTLSWNECNIMLLIIHWLLNIDY